MKHLILLFITWSTAGSIYFIWDTLNKLDHEAHVDHGEPSQTYRAIAYGPIYWVLYLTLTIIAHLYKQHRK